MWPIFAALCYIRSGVCSKGFGPLSKENLVYTFLPTVSFTAYHWFRPAIPNPEQFATMSDKETNRNETPWRARGTKNFTYQEFVDANKANVLKLNLRIDCST